MWVWGNWEFWICSWPGGFIFCVQRAPQGPGDPCWTDSTASLPFLQHPCLLHPPNFQNSRKQWGRFPGRNPGCTRKMESRDKPRISCVLSWQLPTEPPFLGHEAGIPRPHRRPQLWNTGTVRWGKAPFLPAGFGNVFPRSSRGCDDPADLWRSALARRTSGGSGSSRVPTSEAAPSTQPRFAGSRCPPAASRGFVGLMQRGEHGDIWAWLGETFVPPSQGCHVSEVLSCASL